ncbi:MAG TPA: gamma-glutamyltransferase [Vicinamibacterales bacterium]|nr:gamma-glutamyltransferase [Vicinamibacterales bacterium]
MRVLALLLAFLAIAPAGAITQLVPADLGVSSRDGLVVSASDVAADLGADVLAKGGNAVDAAVATAFAMAVTHPTAGNLGGGGFMIVRRPDGTATTFDYRERAPGKATPTMYLGKDGEIDRSLTAAGYLAPGVPGTVRGMALAHSKLGKLPWKDIVLPAAQLAANGFTMSETLARSLNNELRRMQPFPASVAAYGKPGGGQWAAGDRIVLADLAKSLTSIANDGPDAFYTGWIADRIAADMAANGGLITKDDLAAYEAKERAPVKGTFNGYEIISMPPPSSGGVALIEMLNILESQNIQKRKPGSVEALHLTTEAMRRAYLDRARFLGDPDFVQVPIEKLTSKAHARDVARSIDMKRASLSRVLGNDILSAALPAESDETTHFSVIDKDGMAVANTYTLEGGYGSHVVVAGTGILLNNEMGDFNKKPGTTNETGDIGTPPNVIAPGKRMLSSMTPTIVARNGKPVLITGSPGGRTIINTVLTVVLYVTAWERTGREAVDAPRMHHQWLPDRLTIETNGVSDEVLAALKALGHDARAQGSQGSAQTIWMHPITGTAFGVADPRDPTSKAAKPGGR